MIELPEAFQLARQIAETAAGKVVQDVVAAHTPHRLAWYHGDPADYPRLLGGRAVDDAASHGGFVELALGDARVAFGEGVAIRWHAAGAPVPARHQLLLRFTDGSALRATVALYGGLWAYRSGTFGNPYYARAVAAPSPLSEGFDRAHFEALASAEGARRLSLKGLLATEQRVPGLGNGVLQDILFAAGMHPRRRVGDLTESERDALFRAVKDTLAEMARLGGRDTEPDLFGRDGGYRTLLSRRTVGGPCPRCGATIVKEAFLGGAVYLCPACQRA